MEKQAYTVEMEMAKAIYKILTEFEKQLDNEEADSKLLDYRTWKISETRFFPDNRSCHQENLIFRQ